jgi:hypothetical protein
MTPARIGPWRLDEMLTRLKPFTQFLDLCRTVRKHLVHVPDQSQRLPDENRTELVQFLGSWRATLREAGFTATCTTLDRHFGRFDKRSPLQAVDKRMTVHVAVDLMERVIEDFKEDARERLCYIVPASLWSDNGFGPSVTAAFPGATEDANAAVQCFALGRYRAAVFHAVRASEWGLKAVARGAGVKGQIDFKEWGKIIKGIEDKVAVVDKWHNGPAKSNALEFYRDALADARQINNAWRTINLHVRTDVLCGEPEASRALDRAQDFMRRLSSRITEGQSRPLSRRSFLKPAS